METMVSGHLSCDCDQVLITGNLKQEGLTWLNVGEDAVVLVNRRWRWLQAVECAAAGSQLGEPESSTVQALYLKACPHFLQLSTISQRSVNW